jgi:hypothetical protein
MPTRKLALEREGPKRLELSWGAFYKNFQAKLDGAVLNRDVPSKEELRGGLNLTLQDGSILFVQLRENPFAGAGLFLSRDGLPLPGSAGDPAQQINQAAYLLYFLAAINAGVGIIAELLKIEAMQNLGLGYGSMLQGFVYGLLGFFTLKRSFVALAIAIAIYLADGIFTMVMSGGAGGIVVRIFFTVVLVRGASALWGERAAKAASARA